MRLVLLAGRRSSGTPHCTETTASAPTATSATARCQQPTMANHFSSLQTDRLTLWQGTERVSLLCTMPSCSSEREKHNNLNLRSEFCAPLIFWINKCAQISGQRVTCLNSSSLFILPQKISLNFKSIQKFTLPLPKCYSKMWIILYWPKPLKWWRENVGPDSTNKY